MILYHGSNILVDKIDLTKSNKHKDFGQAFYLSDDKGQALKMGEFKVKILNCGSPILSAFDFEESLLGTHSSLNVKIFSSYSLEWAEFVWNNRDEQQEFHHPYDIVLQYYLVEKEHQTVVNAIDTVYNSATYKALSNPETGLYYQSSGYVLDYLLKELQYGKL